MKTALICEGETDELILRAALDPVVDRELYTVIPAGGKSGATSLARTYLATGRERVAFVVDADTTDPQQVAEQQLILGDLLALAGPRERFLVLQAVPVIEAWLFADRELARTLFDASLSEEDVYRARFEPREVLRELLGLKDGLELTSRDLSQLLKPRGLPGLSNIKPVETLREFITAPVAAV